MRSVAFYVALVIVAAGMGCSNPLGPEEDALRSARARWRASAVENYTFDLQRLCFCGSEYTRVVTVVVEDGEIVAATYRDSGSPFERPLEELYTVDDLFEEIFDAIKQEAHSIQVEYDASLGYPTNISIDYSINIADEERSYVVSAFEQES